MAIGTSFGVATAVLACLPASRSEGGSCSLRMDCQPDEYCADTPLQLDWTSDCAEKLSINGRMVPMIRIGDPTVLDTLRTNGADWQMRTEGPAIVVLGDHVSGVLNTIEPEGHIRFSLREISRRSVDGPKPSNVYHGKCEGLF